MQPSHELCSANESQVRYIRGNKFRIMKHLMAARISQTIFSSAIPVQRSDQLSYQANWELVIKLVRNIPGKDEDEIMNI